MVGQSVYARIQGSSQVDEIDFTFSIFTMLRPRAEMSSLHTLIVRRDENELKCSELNYG